MHTAIPGGTAAPWWQAVFFNGLGGSVIGGLVAFLIARQTIQWKRDDDARLDALRRSREAAYKILLLLVDIGPAIFLYKSENKPKLDELFRQLAVTAPLLDDSMRKINERFSQMAKNIADLVFWRTSFDEDPSRYGPDNWQAIATAASECIQTQMRTVYAAMVAHATGKPAPDGEFPAMPQLPDMVDRAVDPAK